MIVNLSELSLEGLPVKGTISLAPLNARMKEGRTNDIEFTTPPSCDLIIYPTGGGGAQASGTVTTTYQQQCGRCLEPKERQLSVKVRFVFSPKPESVAPRATLDEQFVDDINLVYFEGDQLELEELIQESLILELSPYWCPAVDAADACTLCGIAAVRFATTTEDSTTASKGKLGDLISKAAQKKNIH